ncbi:hypothetical protein GGE67_003499 [Rhizobium leucaenae]|nr:hypothetical protein [Rhizobium leucaenae]
MLDLIDGKIRQVLGDLGHDHCLRMRPEMGPQDAKCARRRNENETIDAFFLHERIDLGCDTFQKFCGRLLVPIRFFDGAASEPFRLVRAARFVCADFPIGRMRLLHGFACSQIRMRAAIRTLQNQRLGTVANDNPCSSGNFDIDHHACPQVHGAVKKPLTKKNVS